MEILETFLCVFCFRRSHINENSGKIGDFGRDEKFNLVIKFGMFIKQLDYELEISITHRNLII